MFSSVDHWHRRFKIQASWTSKMRKHLLLEKEFLTPGPILETGCGTGAILADLEQLWRYPIYGIDLKKDYLLKARKETSRSSMAVGNVSNLPFPDQTFSAVVSHYFLMWLSSPAESLSEIRRVTKSGGYFFVFAEPDYGGRIDFPPILNSVKELQIKGLKMAGAEPEMGRNLPSLLKNAGFKNVVSGVYENRIQSSYPEDWIESEQMMLKEDLNQVVSNSKLQNILSMDAEAWKTGTRVVHVPTFYAWGIVP